MTIFNTTTIDYDDASDEVMRLLATRLEHTYCFSIIDIGKTYVLLFNKKHYIYIHENSFYKNKIPQKAGMYLFKNHGSDILLLQNQGF